MSSEVKGAIVIKPITLSAGSSFKEESCSFQSLAVSPCLLGSKKKQVSLKNSYVKVNSDLEEVKRALEVTPSAKVLRLRSTAPARLQLGQKPRLIKRQVKSLKNMVINYEVMKAPLRNFYE